MALSYMKNILLEVTPINYLCTLSCFPKSFCSIQGLSGKYQAFGSANRICKTNSATTRFMPKSSQNIGHSSFWNPQISFSHCHSLIFIDCSPYTSSLVSGVLLVAVLPERGSLWTDSQPSLKRVCHTFICTALTASSPKAFWIIRIASLEDCSSLTQNLMQICCSTCSFWLWRPHSTQTHSMESTTPAD